MRAPLVFRLLVGLRESGRVEQNTRAVVVVEEEAEAEGVEAVEEAVEAEEVDATEAEEAGTAEVEVVAVEAESVGVEEAIAVELEELEVAGEGAGEADRERAGGGERVDAGEKAGDIAGGGESVDKVEAGEKIAGISAGGDKTEAGTSAAGGKADAAPSELAAATLLRVMHGDGTRIGAIFRLWDLAGFGGLASRETRFLRLVVASVLLWSAESGLAYFGIGMCDVNVVNVFCGVVRWRARKKVCVCPQCEGTKPWPEKAVLRRMRLLHRTLDDAIRTDPRAYNRGHFRRA